MYAHELFENPKPRVVVTYPGRFQPFHQGHAGVFAQLQKKFGNENVFIATSNDTSSAKSPFNFSDKYQLMTAAGVPGNHIFETNSMYSLPNDFNPATTVFITAVGAPDADRLNPDSYLKRDKKDKDGNVIKPAGSPGYYKTWNPNEAPLTADQHGYVVVIPEIHKNIKINGQTYNVSHGTDCRNLWNAIRDDDKAKSEFLKQLYGKADKHLADIFNKIPAATQEDIDQRATDTTSPIHGGVKKGTAGLVPLAEFAPDEGGESRKFIPWPEFIEQLKQILHKDFSCKENIVKSTIKARFVPHDPMEFGPTMLYSYYETRAGGRNKGAISTRGSIQVGKYTKGGLFGQNPDQLLTGFQLLKGHPFERHFDLTFDNIYKIANIIQGNTQGALDFQPQSVAEGFDKEAFRRHMADLEAREELRKTDPVSAKALDLRGKLPKTVKKKPEDDSININDPRHPSYGALHNPLSDLNEGSEIARPGQLVSIIQAPRILDLLPGETFEVRSSNEQGVTLKHSMGTKFDNVVFPHGTYKIVRAQGLKEGIFGGLGGPASGPMLARGGSGYAGLSGAKKLRHDAYVELQMVDSLKHTNHNGRYDAEIKKKLLQAQEYLAKAKELEQGLAEGFNSKQEVIDHFVKQGKPAAAGAAAWERGWRGPKAKTPATQAPKSPQQKYWWQDKDLDEDAAGVGVVATNKKMAKDPRYSMSITKDVKPSTPKNQLRAFRLSEETAYDKISDENPITKAVLRFVPGIGQAINAADIVNAVVNKDANTLGRAALNTTPAGAALVRASDVGDVVQDYKTAVDTNENMDHSKDSRAVPELKAALLAHKNKIEAASDDEVYDIIDKLMTRIAKSHGISGQKLHDMWVDEYKQIPDTWIMQVDEDFGDFDRSRARLIENFADGRHPEDKGDSKRYGVPTKASVSTLRKVAKQGGRKGQLAHWMANMKSGKAKANENVVPTATPKEPDLPAILAKFLPIAMKVLEVDALPKIKLEKHIETHDGQATFGRFVNDTNEVHLAIADRHPIDILRTLAHELTHYRQHLNGELKHDSGETGSPQENEAHAVAGVIMRHFDKAYPDALKLNPLNMG